jgi:hypothetical protein
MKNKKNENENRKPVTVHVDTQKWNNLKAMAVKAGRRVSDLLDEAITARLEA